LGENGADAVEMESSLIRAICRAHGIPSATIRVISDAAHETLPLDFNALMTADQQLNYGKLFLRSLVPRKTAALLRLQRQTQLAAKNLAEVLSRVIHVSRTPLQILIANQLDIRGCHSFPNMGAEHGFNSCLECSIEGCE